MAIQLVHPKDQFSGPEEELYRKVNSLIWDKIDGLTSLGTCGVLTYIMHEVMHVAIESESDE